MKKLFFTLFSLLFAVSLVTAQNQSLKVLVVLADFAGTSDVTDTIVNAFNASGYDVTFLTPSDTTQIFDSLATGKFNFVFWEAGNDGVDSLLWKYQWSDVDTQPVQPYAFYDQITNYILNGNIFWLDGIDIIYDVYGKAPDEFQQGDYVYDILGITKYVAQSKDDDGDLGVPYYYKTSENEVTPDVDQVNWKWATLWHADALEIKDDAIPLFKMGGDSDYPLLGQISCFSYYNLIFTQFRLGAVKTQDLANKIVKDILDAAANGHFQPKPEPTQSTQVSNIKLSIFPNPAHSYLHVSAPELTNGVLTVTDIEGRKVYQTQFNKFKTLFVGDFEPGIYLVKIKANNGTVTHKLIIK